MCDAMVTVGVRVVRGEDWKWGDQDGGEGHVGTVIETGVSSTIENSDFSFDSTNKTSSKTVIVQWDCGLRNQYRTGYQGAYDLLVFDNTAAGVVHTCVTCDACNKTNITGIRWKCAECNNYDLCTRCYMSDKHDLSHKFQRLQTANAIGVLLSPRDGRAKILLKGIGIGGKVVRGSDWERCEQYGSREKTGVITNIQSWNNQSVATVTWSTGSTNVYKLGYRGCVDLRFIEGTTCGSYYKEHLPILGEPVLTMLESKTNEIPSDMSLDGNNWIFDPSSLDLLPTNIESANLLQVGDNERRDRSDGDQADKDDMAQGEDTKKESLEDIKKESKDKDKNEEEDTNLEQLRKLKIRVVELEEALMCSICMNRRNNVAFLCGHRLCEYCAAALIKCHLCGNTISQRIHLY